MKSETELRPVMKYFQHRVDEDGGPDKSSDEVVGMCNRVSLGLLEWILGEPPSGVETAFVHAVMGVSAAGGRILDEKEQADA